MIEFNEDENPLWKENYPSVAQLEDWETWAEEVERILGHDLAGDEKLDGYSYDGAFKAYRRGKTPRDYANGVPKKD